MFGSLLKGITFLAVSGLCAAVVIHLLGLSSDITVNINSSELSISVFWAVCVLAAFVSLLLLLIIIINISVSIIRFLSGGDTTLTRYFRKSQYAKGNRALSTALISFYEGDSKQALFHSGKARKLLKNSKLSLLISAQIAQKSGDSTFALENFKRLLGEKDTRLVALSGIVSEKIRAGDYESALTLSKKSVELDPKNSNNTSTLFNLQVQEEDWKGARETLQTKKKYEKIPSKIFMRQEAILIFAEAKEKRSQGLTKEALVEALNAVRQYPDFIPALSFLTEMELMSGNKRRVEKLLQKGWALFPHPDIAKSYSSLVENETAEEKLLRFEVLTRMKDVGPHTAILQVELYLAIKDFVSAKKIISELVKDDPDNYILTLMAAVERGSGASDAVVREWLTKAVYARKSFAWICKECGFQNDWTCVCPGCKSFDTMEWQRPPKYLPDKYNKIQVPIILELDDNDQSALQVEVADHMEIKPLVPNRKEDGLKESDNLKEKLGIASVKKLEK